MYTQSRRDRKQWWAVFYFSLETGFPWICYFWKLTRILQTIVRQFELREQSWSLESGRPLWFGTPHLTSLGFSSNAKFTYGGNSQRQPHVVKNWLNKWSPWRWRDPPAIVLVDESGFKIDCLSYWFSDGLVGLFSFFQVSAVAEREINTLPCKEKQDLSSVPFELKTHALLSCYEMSRQKWWPAGPRTQGREEAGSEVAPDCLLLQAQAPQPKVTESVPCTQDSHSTCRSQTNEHRVSVFKMRSEKAWHLLLA